MQFCGVWRSSKRYRVLLLSFCQAAARGQNICVIAVDLRICCVQFACLFEFLSGFIVGALKFEHQSVSVMSRGISWLYCNRLLVLICGLVVIFLDAQKLAKVIVSFCERGIISYRCSQPLLSFC